MKYEINMMDAKREARNEGQNEGRKEGQAEARKEDVNTLITVLQEVGVKPSIIKQKIMEKYDLSDAEVDKLLKQYN